MRHSHPLPFPFEWEPHNTTLKDMRELFRENDDTRNIIPRHFVYDVVHMCRDNYKRPEHMCSSFTHSEMFEAQATNIRYVFLYRLVIFECYFKT